MLGQKAWLTFPLLVGLALAGCIEAPEDGPRVEGAPDDDDAPATAAGCAPPSNEGDAGGGQGPGSQGGVSNQPGSFSYGGQTALKTATETYTWTNYSTGAMISWGGQSASGRLELIIEDACGVEVYRGDATMMSQGGSWGETERGTAGDWTITLEFSAFTGQMGLSITSA